MEEKSIASKTENQAPGLLLQSSSTASKPSKEIHGNFFQPTLDTYSTELSDHCYKSEVATKMTEQNISGKIEIKQVLSQVQLTSAPTVVSHNAFVTKVPQKDSLTNLKNSHRTCIYTRTFNRLLKLTTYSVLLGVLFLSIIFYFDCSKLRNQSIGSFSVKKSSNSRGK